MSLEKRFKEINEYVNKLEGVTNTTLSYNFVDFENKINNITPINEIGLNRLVDYHFKNGFIIISACQSLLKVTEKENKEYTEQLKSDIRNNGYSFIPVRGGYKETVNDKLVTVYEESFIVPNKGNIKELFDFGKLLCAKYQQETFLFKDDDNTLNCAYYDSQGNKKDWGTYSSLKLNDITKEYFTQLQRSKQKADRRFSFESINFNNYPSTLNEMRRRREGEKELIVCDKETWKSLLM